MEVCECFGLSINELIVKVMINIINLMCLLWVNFLSELFDNPNDNKYLIVLFAGLVTIGVSIVVYRIKHLHDRDIFNKVFDGETTDINRHLKRNLQILIKIKDDYEKKGFYPNKVHFEKMKIQEDIVLFSNEIAVKLQPNRISNLSELRKLIRNLNYELEQAILATGYKSKSFDLFLDYVIEKHKFLIEKRIEEIRKNFVNNTSNSEEYTNSSVKLLPSLENHINEEKSVANSGLKKSDNVEDSENSPLPKEEDDEDEQKEPKQD